jgi:glycosyltransferase involved in cell wall biosynthesis
MAAMAEPLVSVVIPAYESEQFIAEAIESVLAQSHAAVELIVVDDGSKDGTAEIAAAYEDVQLLRQENSGPATARNRGFEATRGELIAFHDADDAMTPEKLEIQVRHLLAHEAVGIVVGEQEVRLEPGAELPFWAEGSRAPMKMPLRPAEFADEPLIHPMTMLMRREVFDSVGGFDEAMRPAEDLDWIFRASEAGIEIARLPEVILRRRVHPGSLTQDAAAARTGLFRAFKARIERHRARAAC